MTLSMMVDLMNFDLGKCFVQIRSTKTNIFPYYAYRALLQI